MGNTFVFLSDFVVVDVVIKLLYSNYLRCLELASEYDSTISQIRGLDKVSKPLCESVPLY